MFKDVLRNVKNYFKIHRAFWNDANQYIKYNYSAYNSQDSLEARILRQTHVLEKGMSLSNPKPGFGKKKVELLFDLLDEFKKKKYDSINSVSYQNAIQTLVEYMKFQEKMGIHNDDIFDRIKKEQQEITMTLKCGITHLNYKKLKDDINSSFPSFVKSRHSCRQFSEDEILDEDLKRVVELSQSAPSACNRQPCKVYYSNSDEINKYLGEKIAGNTGFADEVKKYLIITSSISSFHDDYERNQLYLDAGIYTYSLVLSLHYYGFASCILQNGEFVNKDREMRKKLTMIPPNEKIIVFIAIGKYKDEFNVALSQRKLIDDVLKKI